MSGKKLHEQPLEFQWANDAFALVREYTEDAERIQRELDEAAAAKAAQEQAQVRLPLDLPPEPPKLPI